MQVSKISFNGVENIVPRAEKQKIAFQGDEIPADNEKNNAAKYMIGATLAGLAVLGVLGYKGHLGEGIQKFLGGAKKAAQKEGSNASDSAKKAEEAVDEALREAENLEKEAKKNPEKIDILKDVTEDGAAGLEGIEVGVILPTFT